MTILSESRMMIGEHIKVKADFIEQEITTKTERTEIFGKRERTNFLATNVRVTVARRHTYSIVL